MDKSLTDKFVNQLMELKKEEFPETTINQAKNCILDYLGVTMAGAKMFKEKGNMLLDFFNDEKGDISVIGFGRKTTIQNAVFINGISSHVAELDDGQRFGMIHLGAPIISALIPIAVHKRISGKDLITAVIIAYESAIRIASAIQPSHKELGYHATGTCGTIGAAVGVAIALGFTRCQLKDAISSAATAASGILEIIEDGSELKPFNVGKAALNGLMAALSAGANLKGPDDILGGKRGFFSIMANKLDLSHLEIKTGDTFSIEKVYMKPYAACRHCHPAIEAAIKIASNSKFCKEDIKDIKVRTYKLAVGGHDHTMIQGINSAKMSIPYSVAAAIVLGKAGIGEFSKEYIDDMKISSIIKKVMVYSDDELSALVPKKRAAIVEITTNDNKCYVERVDFPKGEPENPLDKEDIESKFISLARYGEKSQEEADEIIECVWNLENDLYKLINLL